jgi:hypothetical protein
MTSFRSRRHASVLVLLGLFAALSAACHRPRRTRGDVTPVPSNARAITASCNGIARSGSCRQLTMSPPSQGGDGNGIDRFLPTAESECKDAGGKVQIPAAPCPTEHGVAAVRVELARGVHETFFFYDTPYVDDDGTHAPWTTESVDELLSGKCRSSKCEKVPSFGVAATGAAVATHGAWRAAGAGPVEATLREVALAARGEGKVPVAYLHAKWCGPCRAIDAYKDEPRMAKAFSHTHVVAIDLDRADEDELHRLGIETTRLPVFYVLDATGKATRDKIDGGAWGENVPENMAPPLERFFAAQAMAESMKRELEAHPDGRAGQKVSVGRGQAQHAALGDHPLTAPRARR